MIRVLVADDSPTARQLMVSIVAMDPQMTVCGVATDGLQAVAMTKELRPDVVLMDIQMPKMNGLDATKLIMTERPTPIIIVSGHREVREVSVAVEALRAGALTALPKPHGITSPEFHSVAEHLLETVRTMAQVSVRKRIAPLPPPSEAPPPAPAHARPRSIEVVVATASTGGTTALHRLLSEMPRDGSPPILVVQHLSSGFVAGLAISLGRNSHLRVRIPRDMEPLEGGSVYLAPYGSHMVLLNRTTIGLQPKRAPDRFCPSANVLFQSAAEVFGGTTMALVLSGLGDDGVEGCRAVKAAGGQVVAQDEASSAVFGVAKLAVEADLVDRVLSIDKIRPWLSIRTQARARL